MNQRGFTLIEIIISIGILGLIAALGLIISMDFFRSYAFRYEENVIVSGLQKARSRSMANIDQTTHGFCWNANEYIIFEGSTCPATGGDRIPRSKSMSLSSTVSGNTVIFQQLDGASSTTGDVTVSGDGKTATITINSAGAIIY